jgi:hypothetical protein
MFAFALLAAAMAEPRLFLAPAYVPAQPGPVLVNPAMLSPMPSAPVQTYGRASAPTMVLEEAGVVVSNLPATGTLIATNASDFGGSTIPVIGLVVLAATIALLAGPVED